MINNYAKELLSKNWTELTNPIKDIKKKDPGVYLISWDEKELEGEKVQLKDVYYIGMTNSKGGVKSRLKQFWNGITKGRSHSGGNRWYKENGEYKSSDNKKFYYAYVQIECEVDKSKRKPKHLRKMGDVTKLEYEMMARFKQLGNSNFDGEPEGNKK